MIPGIGQFPEGQIIAFALVFLRIVAFVVAMPVIGTASVPVPVKVLFSLVLAVLLTPVLKFQNADLIVIGDQVVFLTIREICLGLFLGYLMRLFFFAVSIAGEIVGISSGAASAQLFNPAMGAQGNVLEQFYITLGTLFFFGLNGHHIFLQGLANSFEIVPVADIALKSQAFAGITGAFQAILVMGLKLSSPIMISVLLTNLSMGVLGRAVPQMNVLVTSLQVTFLVTIFVLILTVPFLFAEMQVLLKDMANQFMSVMKVL